MTLLQEPRPSHIGSPLPGGAAAVVRFFFNLPQWFQIAGFFVGLAVAAWLAVRLWRHRAAVRTWFVTRRRAVQVGLLSAVAVVALGAAFGGAESWHYMQHDNGFCTGCHVMGTAYRRFTQSEHDSLQCHQCHQQSIFASARQLYLWVAERPQVIGPHAKVPNGVCARCHIQGADQKEIWKRISKTAGHRVHLESDSAVLKNVQCVTCHGVELHHFAPVDSTCGQSKCHDTKRIELGRMARQTNLHCVTCHPFKADVPPFVTRDSARGSLVPGDKQCLDCHEMQQVVASFDPARDPHRGTCGMCHNPHTQKRPAEAKASCATAACHGDWRKIPFHIGRNHQRLAQDCTTCHLPHQARVDPSDCAGCHAAVKARKAGRVTPPLPFDTSAALRRVSLAPPHERLRPMKGKGDGPFLDDPPPAPRPPAAVIDSFPHDRHKSLPCITCHLSTRGHGRLTFEPPRGCQICHHQAPETSSCNTCHPSAGQAVESVTVKVAVANAPAREHRTQFAHATHAKLRCVQCHTTAVTLAPGDRVAACAECHDDHHQAARPCAACHSDIGPDARVVHTPPVDAHVSCDACHLPAIVGRLVPDRELCLTCHVPQRTHYVSRECTECHFQNAPAAFQAHLRRASKS
jgi:nitrate/TMAO reductase-like tetraheme cytochrome c subunit